MSEESLSTELPLELPTLRFDVNHSRWAMKCLSLGAVRINADRVPISIIAAGPDTTVKAARGILMENCKPDWRLTDPDGEILCCGRKLEGKYTCVVQKLAPGTVAILARRNDPGVLWDASEQALWRVLSRSEYYTTPLLRHWIPWLHTELIERRRLVMAEGYDTSAGMLRLGVDELDALVCEGVREGHLPLRQETQTPTVAAVGVA
ncbi:MAG: hypothetical protein ACOY3P_20225 [Planctomycetota bacterium]